MLSVTFGSAGLLARCSLLAAEGSCRLGAGVGRSSLGLPTDDGDAVLLDGSCRSDVRRPRSSSLRSSSLFCCIFRKSRKRATKLGSTAGSANLEGRVLGLNFASCSSRSSSTSSTCSSSSLTAAPDAAASPASSYSLSGSGLSTSERSPDLVFFKTVRPGLPRLAILTLLTPKCQENGF